MQNGHRAKRKREEMQCEVNQNNHKGPVYLTFDLILFDDSAELPYD